MGGRYVRDRNNLKTKLPLNECMVVHQDESFLKDVEGLKEYIVSELNVKNVTFSSDMADYIRLSAEPEYKSLGAKFKRKTGAMSKAIKKLGHKELLSMMTDGYLNVCEEKLCDEDVKIIWNFEGDKEKWVYKEGGDGCIVLMDRRITKKLKDEGTAREICNRIQKMRKEAKLVPADVVNAFYSLQEQKDEDICSVFEDFCDLIAKHTRIKVMPIALKSEFVGTICSEITDIEGKSVKLELCVPQLFFDEKVKKNESVCKYLQSQDIQTLRQKYPNGSTFKFAVDGKEYAFEVGKEFVYNAADLKLK